jgi:TetR/AcrR family transcriptional repressor of nem operon
MSTAYPVWEDWAMAGGRAGDDGDTATRILDSAESLVQIRGFNGFSYADVAGELSLTTASLHYHFPGKAELGRALIARYALRFNNALAEIDARGGDAPARLRAYASLYADVLRGRRMCLCGMLAAEYQTLPEPMRDAVIGFFDENEAWVESVLARGRDDGTLAFEGSPREGARLIVSALEGAMLVARPYGDVGRFEHAAERLLAGFAETP